MSAQIFFFLTSKPSILIFLAKTSQRIGLFSIVFTLKNN